MKQLSLTLVFLLALASCSRRSGPDVEAAARPAEPPQVKLAQVESRTVERTAEVTGSLLADETVNLSFEVAGTLLKLYADFGQDVKQGQVLAELDCRDLTLQLERSRAALAQALARVGLSPDQADATPDTTPAIRQAQAQAEDARFKYESAARLVKSGDVSQERFNELDKAYRAREAALQATRDELRTQMAGIQGMRADARLVEKRLSDTILKSPFDGAVTQRLASPGQYLKDNTTVLTVVKAWPLRLRADIPESGVGEVRIGTSLTFTTDATPGAVFHAVVREMNPALDARSRSLAAEARLVEADSRLRPGMFVRVRLVTARNAPVVVVPKAALYKVAGLTKVFAVRDGAVVEYRVEPQEELGDWVVIPNVLKPGDSVATTNLGDLVNGLKVRVQG